MTGAAILPYVAFVRAVMVGREGLHREVLVDIFHRAGAADVVSHLTTGNVSFFAAPARVDAIVDAAERSLMELLERPTPLFVRSLDELVAMLDAQPFDELAPDTVPSDAVRDRIVTFFRRRVPDALQLPMSPANGDWVVFAAGSAEVFSVTRARDDRHPGAPGGRIERVAGEPVTSRAVTTIERIVAKLAGAGGHRG